MKAKITHPFGVIGFICFYFVLFIDFSHLSSGPDVAGLGAERAGRCPGRCPDLSPRPSLGQTPVAAVEQGGVRKF